MCKDAIYYNGTSLWSHWDSRVTSNTFNFEFFTYQTSNQQKLQQPKFKFTIYSQSTTSSSITMYSSELYKYIYNLKSKICNLNKGNDNILRTHLTNLSKDKKYTDGFVHTTNSKNNLYTTFIYNELLDSPCIRFMIGEKEKSILDTDKVYVPMIEFYSLILTLDKAFDNYCLMSQNVTLLDYLKKLEDKIDNSINSFHDNINNIKKDSRCVKEYIETTECIKLDSNDVKKNDNINHEIDELSIDSLDDELGITKTENKVDTVVVKDDESDDVSNIVASDSEFDSFLKENRDSYELDLPKETKQNLEKTQKEIILENLFQKKILKNDIKNLDIIIKNCVNSGTPLDSFVNTVFDVCGLDLFNGISNGDKYCLSYVISQNIKYNVGNFISKGKKVPSTINPIIVEDKDKTHIQDKIDCMYFLLMSYIYYSKIRTDLSDIKDENVNKGIVTYCLKTITSPFVFSYMLNINKDILVESVCKLYNDLKYNSFFSEYENDIKLKTGISVDVSSVYLKEQIEKLYDNIQLYKDKLVIKNFFNKNIMMFNYEDLYNIKETYNLEIVKNIVKLEHYKDKSDTLKNVKTTVGIPLNILNKLGISDHKFDNNILIKYIKLNFPEFKDFEQIKNINSSVYDILDNIDIKDYPLNILKALYFWNVDRMPKNITYDDFVKNINNSNLEVSELVSMIYDNRYKEDDDFYKALTCYE